MERRNDFLGPWLAFALALFAPIVFGLARFDAGAALAALALAAGSVLSGQAASRLLRLPRRPGFTAAFEMVVGFFIFAALELGAAEALHAAPIPAAAVAGAVAAGFRIWARMRGEPGAAAPVRGGAAWDAAAIFASSLLAILWSREAMGAWRGAQVSGIMRADYDFAAHASQINYLLHFPIFHGKSLNMAGSPHALYHMGTYPPAAFLAAAAHLLSFEATIIFWLPAGLMLLGMAAYGLGAALGGRWAGTAAVLALFLIPDPAHYGLRSNYVSFIWLLEVSPSLAYGVALALIALALYVLGVGESRFDLIAKGGVVALFIALFKEQIAIPTTGLFICLIFAIWRPKRAWHRGVALGVGSAGAAAVVLLFQRLPYAPHFLTGPWQFEELFRVADETAVPPFHGLYATWSAHAPAWRKGLIGVALLLPEAFGLVLPALIAFSVGPLRPRWPRSVRALPFLVLAVYLAGIFLIPTTGPKVSTEFSHRPLTLVYAALVCFLAAAVAAWVRPLAARGGWRRAAVAATTLALAGGGLAATVAGSRDVQAMRHYEARSRQPLTLEYLADLAFLRAHAAPTDWILASDGDPYGWTTGLTERPAYFSLWLGYSTFGKSPFMDTFWARFHLGAVLQHMRSYPELQAFGRKYGIRWFILLPGDMRGWPPKMIRHRVFQRGGFPVFDLGSDGAPGSG